MNAVNKLLNILGEKTKLYNDNWTKNHLYISGNKKWIAKILPYELLKRSLNEAISSLNMMNENGLFFEYFPPDIATPDYGDKWGRSANYIEINNRSIAEMHKNKTKNGLLSTIKLLPAIPPSAKSWANCIILSQIFPNIYGDGYNKAPNEENSLYGIKLNTNYSRNIINFDIINEISQEEQLKAFNDIAHFHGLKTGFRTVISSDQIKVVQSDKINDVTFNWKNKEHENLFIDEHAKLVKLGFEAIFIDSAKHIGGYDMQNYTGIGALPEYAQMQHIIHEIRVKSKSTTLSFIGEKSSHDFQRYINLGLTGGTAFIEPDNYEEVKKWSKKFKYIKKYAPGVEVSNDNSEGGRSYEFKLNRINSSLFGYEYPSDKLPSFMQTEDLFPLRYDTTTHRLMMSNPSYSTDGTPLSHWKNLFAKEDGRNYNAKVADLFFYALNL